MSSHKYVEKINVLDNDIIVIFTFYPGHGGSFFEPPEDDEYEVLHLTWCSGEMDYQFMNLNDDVQNAIIDALRAKHTEYLRGD